MKLLILLYQTCSSTSDFL